MAWLNEPVAVARVVDTRVSSVVLEFGHEGQTFTLRNTLEEE